MKRILAGIFALMLVIAPATPAFARSSWSVAKHHHKAK